MRFKRILRDFMQELLLLFTSYSFTHLGEGISRCNHWLSEKPFLTYTSLNKLMYSLCIFLPRIILRMHTKLNVENNEFLMYLEDNQLGYYLAGLIEADGSIIVPKDNSKNTPTISISFNIEDKPLANCIKSRLGFGSLEMIENKNAVRLTIRGKYNIITLVSLINGKFRTPKIDKLHKVINYINSNWLNVEGNFISLKFLDTSPLNNNSWLAGFSDGDVNLGINITWPEKAKNGYGQVRLTFELVQSRIDSEHLEKYKSIMKTISIFLKSKLENYNLSKFDRTGKQKAWRARITNKEGATVLVNYFDNFPMFSSKYLNYQDWRKAYEILIIRKEHIGKNKLNTYNNIKYLKDSMNKKRFLFNWDHLDNFYK